MDVVGIVYYHVARDPADRGGTVLAEPGLAGQHVVGLVGGVGVPGVGVARSHLGGNINLEIDWEMSYILDIGYLKGLTTGLNSVKKLDTVTLPGGKSVWTCNVTMS